jgi:uncharacterized protein YqiB (DUF1249 family)
VNTKLKKLGYEEDVANSQMALLIMKHFPYTVHLNVSYNNIAFGRIYSFNSF